MSKNGRRSVHRKSKINDDRQHGIDHLLYTYRPILRADDRAYCEIVLSQRNTV